MNDALYYPYINFQDTNWIKAMSLFYNRIYRIVPPNLEAHYIEDTDDIKPLIDSGMIGINFTNLDKYTKEFKKIARACGIEDVHLHNISVW